MLLIGPRLPLTFQVTISVKKQAEIPAWGKIGGESKTEWTLFLSSPLSMWRKPEVIEKCSDYGSGIGSVQ